MRAFPVQKISFLMAVYLQLFSPLAIASLGDDSASVEKDRDHFHCKLLGQRKFASHQMKEITADGIAIREYINNEGKIFAISWNGSNHPDLSALLGEYFEEFKAKNISTPKLRGQRSYSRLETDHIILERSGHMRAVRGKAYIPELVPVGVVIDELH